MKTEHDVHDLLCIGPQHGISPRTKPGSIIKKQMTPSDPGTEYAIIDTRERFDNALSSLVTESCRAWDHWTLLLHLNDAYEKYAREFYQTPAFWSTVTRSLQDISILRIATLLE
jgi:hypothetical protein